MHAAHSVFHLNVADTNILLSVPFLLQYPISAILQKYFAHASSMLEQETPTNSKRKTNKETVDAENADNHHSESGSQPSSKS